MVLYCQRDKLMEMAIENDSFLENYLGLLNGLSREAKMKLVENLNSDINNNIASETGWIDRLYGSFKSDKPVEGMVFELRAARQFNREITSF
jgi:hypothetical protein